jgi:hypothetical protein
MDKQQLLSELKQMAQTGQVSQAEVLSAFNSAPVAQNPEAIQHQSLKLSEIMYYIGGAIVFLGICVLVEQNWDFLSSGLRIFITLGSFIAAFIVAILLERYKDLKKVAQAFFLIGGMLGPLAFYITFHELNFDISSSSIQLLIFLILTAIFFGVFYFYRSVILLFFGIVFATAIFHLLINIIVGNNLSDADTAKVWEYRLLVYGLAYMFLGYYLSSTLQKVLSGVMYGFGSLFFLGSALILGGWSPDQNAFWELIYPLLVFGLIFLSVYVKSKAFLVFGTIFLIGYILKITGEYFTSGLGWPLALVIAGLAIMGVGYYAVRLNKKYFTHIV